MIAKANLIFVLFITLGICLFVLSLISNVVRAADLDDVDVGEKSFLGSNIKGCHKLPAHQALAHEPAFHMQSATVSFSEQCHKFNPQECLLDFNFFVFERAVLRSLD